MCVGGGGEDTHTEREYENSEREWEGEGIRYGVSASGRDHEISFLVYQRKIYLSAWYYVRIQNHVLYMNPALVDASQIPDSIIYLLYTNLSCSSQKEELQLIKTRITDKECVEKHCLSCYVIFYCATEPCNRIPCLRRLHLKEVSSF